MRAGHRSMHFVLAAALCGLVVVAYGYRRDFIRAIFLDAQPRPEPPALAMDPELAAASLPPVERVRVVVIDGLGRATALGLPALNRLCAEGLDLIVDTGFPTVSLPVQHALWTGLTQQQSGILFRGKEQVLGNPRPLTETGIPAQVPDSLAIAESHAYIAHALGFAQALPPSPTELPPGWADRASERGFMATAQDAVASERRLVLVHILRVDVAGHRQGGRDSAAYARAARAADEMLADLIAAERAAHTGGTRWLVLSDHGHRDQGLYGPGGGHGSGEPLIRQVRGCIAGELAPPDTTSPGPAGYVHMIDMARAIADSLGVPLGPGSAGRPLYAALQAPVQSEITLPPVPPGRWLAASVVLAAALLGTALVAGRRWSLWPWWWPVALACVTLLVASPSLAVPMVYRPLGRDVYVSALPGLGLLAVLATAALRRQSPGRMLAAQLGMPVAGCLAAILLSSGSQAPLIGLGMATEPPLMPVFTAYASVLTVLVYAAALVLALALVITALRRPG